MFEIRIQNRNQIIIIENTLSQSMAQKQNINQDSQLTEIVNEVRLNKLKNIHKSLHIVDSPNIVFSVCDQAYHQSRNNNFKEISNSLHNKTQCVKETITSLQKLKLKNKCNNSQTYRDQILKRNKYSNEKIFKLRNKRQHSQQLKYNYAQKFNHFDTRKIYATMKANATKVINNLEANTENVNVSDILAFKQETLSSFFHQIIKKIGNQCRQKAQTIEYVWNSTMKILQLVLNKLITKNTQNQKQNIQQILDNHEKYQSMLLTDRQQIQRLKAQLYKSQVFANTLVFNMRCKQKQLKKSYIKIKICTNKINEYRSNYLELQKDHLDLIMETKEVSKQTAQYLLKRRQQLILDKKKNFKLKFSKKANIISAKEYIQNENKLEKMKIQGNLHQTFNKQFLIQNDQAINNNKKLKKLSNFMPENAMDDFQFYQHQEQIDQQMFASKLNIVLADAQTDMEGMESNQVEQQVQVTYIDKIINGQSKNRGDQAGEDQQKKKVKKKVLIDTQIQCEQRQLNQLSLSLHKFIDMSFLFEKNIPSQPNAHYSSVDIQKARNNSNGKYVRRSKRDSLGTKNPSQISIILPSKRILKSKKNIGFNQQQFSHTQKQFSQYQKKDVQEDDDFQDKRDEFVSLKSGISEYSTKFKSKKKKSKKKHMLNFADSNSSLESGDNESLQRSQRSNISQPKKNKNQTLNMKKSKIQPFKKQEKKKKLKKQVIIKNDNVGFRNQQILSRRTIFDNAPENKRLINALSKSKKETDHLVQCTVTFQNIKQQNPDIFEDLQMQEYLQCKNDEEQEQFFKKFYSSINPLIVDLYKRIDSNKNYNKKLLPARHRNLCKILSNVYMQAYQLLQKKQKLYSLINPLFHYFQIGYGTIKKYDLYSKMISFLAHIFLHKQECFIFRSFFFFTGIDKTSPLSQKVTAQDFHLYLKLLKNLSPNFNMNNLNIQSLYTTNVIIEEKMRIILNQEKLNNVIISKVIAKVNDKLLYAMERNNKPNKPFNEQQYSPNKQILNSFTKSIINKQPTTNWKNISNSSHHTNRNLAADLSYNNDKNSSQTNRESLSSGKQQVKLDVFKCCQIIMEQIIMLKKNIQESYLPLVNCVYEEQQSSNSYRIDQNLISFIINIQFRSKVNEVKCYSILKNLFKINTLYNQYKLRNNIASLKTIAIRSNRNVRTLKSIKTLKTIKDVNEWEQEISSMFQQEFQPQQTLSVFDMCSFFLKANISDFNKTYYNALSVFKIRQEAAFNMANLKLPEIRKVIVKEKMKIEMIVLQEIDYFGFNKTDISVKQIQNKKLLILILLRIVEIRVNQLLEEVIGHDLTNLYNILSINKLII